MKSIFTPARTLTLLVDEKTLEHRRSRWKPPCARVTHGYLSRYAAMVGGAENGAVLQVP